LNAKVFYGFVAVNISSFNRRPPFVSDRAG
jgi:hypothetical protein